MAVLFAGAIISADTKERRTTLPARSRPCRRRDRARSCRPRSRSAWISGTISTADLSICAPSQSAGGCTALPADQVDFIPALGQLTYRPGTGKEIEAYDPGQNRVIVAYRSQADPAHDNGVFTWSFVSKS